MKQNKIVYKESGSIVLLTLNQCTAFFNRLKWYMTRIGTPEHHAIYAEINRIVGMGSKRIQLSSVLIANAYCIDEAGLSAMKSFYQKRPAEFYLDFVDWSFPSQKKFVMPDQRFLECTVTQYMGVIKLVADLGVILESGTVSLSGLSPDFFDKKPTVKDPMEILHLTYAANFSIDELNNLWLVLLKILEPNFELKANVELNS